MNKKYFLVSLIIVSKIFGSSESEDVICFLKKNNLTKINIYKMNMSDLKKLTAREPKEVKEEIMKTRRRYQKTFCERKRRSLKKASSQTKCKRRSIKKAFSQKKTAQTFEFELNSYIETDAIENFFNLKGLYPENNELNPYIFQ